MRPRVSWGNDFCAVRMYSSLPAIFRGWSRIYYAARVGSPWRVLAAAAFVILCGFSAYVALAWGLVPPRQPDRPLARPARVAHRVGHPPRRPHRTLVSTLYAWSGNPRRNALLFPVGGSMLLGIFARALQMCVTKKVEWRGTAYSHTMQRRSRRDSRGRKPNPEPSFARSVFRSGFLPCPDAPPHLRRHGARVSEIGLGCWQLGGSDWGDVSDEQALETLRAAVDAGVNFFDTADVYGLGRSETLVGRFLKQSRASGSSSPRSSAASPSPAATRTTRSATFRAHTEASLRRLGVEALDLTQLHCIPTDVLMSGEPFDWLRRLQKEGKIRHFGASVESMDEALYCVAQEGVASLQIIFNIFRQKPIDTLFAAAREKGVALIVRLPLASGLLSGKMTQADAVRRQRPPQLQPRRPGVQRRRDVRRPAVRARRGSRRRDQAARAAGHGHGADGAALVPRLPRGERRDPRRQAPEQARENAKASDAPPLPRELHEQLASRSTPTASPRTSAGRTDAASSLTRGRESGACKRERGTASRRAPRPRLVRVTRARPA